MSSRPVLRNNNARASSDVQAARNPRGRLRLSGYPFVLGVCVLDGALAAGLTCGLGAIFDNVDEADEFVETFLEGNLLAVLDLCPFAGLTRYQTNHEIKATGLDDSGQHVDRRRHVGR